MHPREILPRAYLPRELRSKTLLHVAVILATVAVGTIAYALVDGASLGDSFYFVVMVMTLIGANNPRTFGGDLVGIAVAVVSVGVLLSFLTQVLGPAALAQDWERFKVRKAKRMKNHIVLCGYSDTARVLLERLPKDEVLVVVKDPALAESLSARGYPAIAGNYETAEALRRAGVEESRAVVAASPEDSENAFVALTAKIVAPGVPVFATVSSEENVDKLKAARADRIISPALLSAAAILESLGSPGGSS